MRRELGWLSIGVIAFAFSVCVVLLALATAVRAGDGTCHAIPVTADTPSGIAGCTLDGPTDGVASWYSGGTAAVNWCTYPWRDCGWIAVQSHATGLVIRIAPHQFCDCWWTTDRRLVDLTFKQVLALGLNPADGLFAVTVTPLDTPDQLLPDGGAGLPNTAVR